MCEKTTAKNFQKARGLNTRVHIGRVINARTHRIYEADANSSTRIGFFNHFYQIVIKPFLFLDFKRVKSAS